MLLLSERRELLDFICTAAFSLKYYPPLDRALALCTCSMHPLLINVAVVRYTVSYPDTVVQFSDWLIFSRVVFFDWMMGGQLY